VTGTVINYSSSIEKMRGLTNRVETLKIEDSVSSEVNLP
jgi:hypothetical protein